MRKRLNSAILSVVTTAVLVGVALVANHYLSGSPIATQLQQLANQQLTALVPSSTPSILGVSEQKNDAVVVVERVVDGDTVVIQGGKKVRLIAIDTPEMTGDPAVRCYGEEAKALTVQLVEGASVRLEYDKDLTDRYNRELAYIWKDEYLVNELIAQAGAGRAKAYPPNTKYQQRLEIAAEAARDAKMGLWSKCGTEEK